VLELWLVRHGETTWNREGRVQGSSDPPLSEAGREGARRLGRRLAGTRFDAVYTSDLRRARETAALALPGAAAIGDARLRELDFGAWEGRLWRDVAEGDGAALSAWLRDPYTNAPSRGEPYGALVQRVQAWRAQLPPEGRVVAFSHGGPILSLLYALTGTPAARGWRFSPAPGSLSKLVLTDEGAVITVVGDAAHLESWVKEDPA
jgi:broad specificity phosphatase PhoE